MVTGESGTEIHCAMLGRYPLRSPGPLDSGANLDRRWLNPDTSPARANPGAGTTDPDENEGEQGAPGNATVHDALLADSGQDPDISTPHRKIRCDI